MEIPEPFLLRVSDITKESVRECKRTPYNETCVTVLIINLVVLNKSAK